MKYIKLSFVIILTALLFGCDILATSKPKCEPGNCTIKNLLATAMQPVGTTMYTWGGGWNIEDTGAGKGATHIGVMPEWEEFFSKQDPSYKFTKEKSPDTNGFKYIDYGLDCSGFIGWTIYNVLNKENNKTGYVYLAEDICQKFSELGWGYIINKNEIKDYKPGDIMGSSEDGHVWISIGQCDDSSVLFVHSSPSGVQINGTCTLEGNDESKAIKLATHYMSKFYSNWYKKYPNCKREINYLKHYDQMRFYISEDSKIQMKDPENYRNMSPEEIMKNLFKE